MESNHIDDSLNSNEEVDQPEQENNNVGVGRSYECVFCKRGFTTAQALGGHMNIHRKDRAKSKPSTSASSNKHEENYTVPRVYQQTPSCPSHYAASQEAQLNYRTYFPASRSSTRSLYGNNNSDSHDHNQQGLNPYGDDWRMSFSLQFGAEHIEDMRKRAQDEGQENDLDLELRLGPDP